MCGIAGFAYLDSTSPVDQGVLSLMRDRLQHRGPDDVGNFVGAGVALGMRRLSIIDVVGGNQPLSNESRDKWLVCNGEIYSHKALRNSLEHHGHKFSSQSDVEVILHAYEQYGDDFIDLINGMFAFALWDEERQKLILARDRTGIKPLYYSIVGDQIIFASELRAMLQHPAITKEIDYFALNQYLTYEYVPSPRSILKNVSKLPPGHILEFSRFTGVRQRRYWNVSFERSESRPPLNLREIKGQFLRIFGEAVQSEMMSDVPLGIFLSGGLDSSAVAAMAVKSTTEKIKTFSIKFQDSSFDESNFALLAARHIGTEHHVWLLEDSEILNITSKLHEYFDEPLGDSSFVPTLSLSRFARTHVKVALGGDGGDELFAGYPTMQAHRFIEFYERLIPFRLRASVIPSLIQKTPVSFNNISWDFKARQFLRGRGVSFAIRHHLWLGSFSEEEKTALLHPRLAYSDFDSFKILSEHLADCDAINPYNRMLYLDMKMYLEGDILAKVDRASMAHSLEVRVPMLNQKMLNFVLSLPIYFKFRRLTGKYLLKEAMRHILPPQIIARSKKGFNMPVAKLLKGPLKELLCDNLSRSTIERQGIFNANYIDGLVNAHMKGQADCRKKLWTLFAFQLWWSNLENIRA